MKCLSAILLIITALLITPHYADAQQSEPLTAVRAAAMVDVVNGRLVDDAVVLVRGNRIEAAGSGLAIPAGAHVVDLGDRVLLPGLIDAHTHVTITPDYSEVNPILFKSVPYRTVEAVSAARKALMVGFTTIRDVDSEGADWADVAVRDGIDDGLIPGPRMQVATLAISITGGYMNNDVAPGIDVPQFGSLADSPAEIVKTLREQVQNGTDWIKLYATGTTRHIDLDNMEPLPQFTDEDIQLVVDEAARFGKPVAAHAYGGPAALAAVEAGVRSIEHGMMLSDETLDLMVERGTFWVPTINVYFPGEGQEMTERQRAITESHRLVFGRAVEKGVRIAYGTDVGALPHGENAVDFAKMVEYGMAPLQAVQSATVVAAELMQWEDQVGSLEEGKFADIIAVNGNPLEDIDALWNVDFVMKDGAVYRQPD